MTALATTLIDKLQQLPVQRLAEVEASRFAQGAKA